MLPHHDWAFLTRCHCEDQGFHRQVEMWPYQAHWACHLLAKVSVPTGVRKEPVAVGKRLDQRDASVTVEWLRTGLLWMVCLILASFQLLVLVLAGQT